MRKNESEAEPAGAGEGRTRSAGTPGRAWHRGRTGLPSSLGQLVIPPGASEAQPLQDE